MAKSIRATGVRFRHQRCSMNDVPLETKLVSAEELLRMPTDGLRVELVDGEVKKMSPAGFEHGRIAMIAGASLSAYVRQRDLGEVSSSSCVIAVRVVVYVGFGLIVEGGAKPGRPACFGSGERSSNVP